MNRRINTLIVMAVALVLASSCNSNNSEDPKEESPKEQVIAKANEEGEAYLESIDLNDSLYKVNSLYYSREVNGDIEWTQVIMTLNDSNQLLKMEEQFLLAGSETMFSNHFYFKEGKKYATKQFFLEGEQDSSFFVELLSYYDEDEKVTATKKRTAPYEDLLTQELYYVTENKDCSADRAFDIANQTGSFETTFQGFVDMAGFKYLVVGEDKKDGFSSALIVQQTTPLIMELRNDESALIGTPLVVNFQTITDATGSQQILFGVARRQ